MNPNTAPQTTATGRRKGRSRYANLYANTASTAALVLAVAGTGGVAYAAGLAKNSVGSPQIKNGQVKTADLGKNVVKGPKVANGSLSLADLDQSTKDQLTAGPTAYHDALEFHALSSNNADDTIFEVTVPEGGSYAVSASGTLTNAGGETRDYSCELTQPVGDFTRTIAAAEVRLDGNGDRGAVALDGVAIDSAGGGTVTMRCGADIGPWTGQILDPRIVLVELGEAVEK